MRRFITISTLAVSLLSAAFLAQAEGTQPAQQATAQVAFAATVADYTVFLDQPTGFVFVKLPQGWKFAGKSDSIDMARLPANVVTNLLPAEDTAVAAAPATAAGKL